MLNEEATNFIIELVAEHYEITAADRKKLELKPLTPLVKQLSALKLIAHGLWEIIYDDTVHTVYFDRRTVKEL